MFLDLSISWAVSDQEAVFSAMVHLQIAVDLADFFNEMLVSL